MSIIGTWASHVVRDDLLIGELLSRLKITAVTGGAVSGTYKTSGSGVTSAISGTFDGITLEFEVLTTGFVYNGTIQGDSIVFPFGRRRRKRGPKADGDDGTWTAEKTGGGGGVPGGKKKKGAAARKKGKVAVKKR